jgi:hypothetical protein
MWRGEGQGKGSNGNEVIEISDKKNFKRYCEE